VKILLVSTSSGSRGGGELCLLYLGRALRDRGHQVTLWVSQHERMDELATRFAEYGEVFRTEYTNTYDRRGRSFASYLDPKTPSRVAAQWRTLAPDVIHINKQNLEDGLDLTEAARIAALPVLAMIHITQSAAYLKARFAAVRDFVARRALQRFPGLLVTTPESRRKDLSDFLGDGSRVRIVTNGVPIPDQPARETSRNQVREEFGFAPGQLLLMAVGRMVPQKRPMLFLETAAQIHARFPAARFLWVGDGHLSEDWDRWVAAKNLGSVIQRLAWRNDVPRLLDAADVFVHVADFEGLAFAILEALAAGLPCAITPNLLAEMTFLDEHNSIAIQPDPAWMEVLGDSAKLCEVGKAARTLAERDFSFDRMAADYETLYREVVAARR
jgi:glycosyltransferase involved in cell wall biosynthesis